MLIYSFIISYKIFGRYQHPIVHTFQILSVNHNQDNKDNLPLLSGYRKINRHYSDTIGSQATNLSA